MVEVMEAWEMELSTKAESTRRQYLDHFKRFCERWEKTPREIYDLFAKTRDPREKQYFRNMLKIHMKDMQKSGLAASTCRMAYKAVSSFFEAQGVDFSLKAKDQPRGQYNGQRRIKADQIRQMWDAASWEFKLRGRALIMFLKDSGLRISDVALLDVEDYRNAHTVIHNGEKFKVFKPTETKKTGRYAYVRIGPETVEAVDDYLKKERMNPPPHEPLFVMRNGKRFTIGALSNVFYRLAQKMDGEATKISAHSFRKFHTTMLEARMNSSWIAKLQGKTLGGGWAPYSKPEGDDLADDPDKLTNAYIDAYDELRVFRDEAKEDAERDRRIHELEAQLARWTDKFGDIETFEERMNRMQQKYENSIDEIKEHLAWLKQYLPGFEEVRIIPDDTKLVFNGVEVDPDKLGDYIRKHGGREIIPPEVLQRLKKDKKRDELDLSLG